MRGNREAAKTSFAMGWAGSGSEMTNASVTCAVKPTLGNRGQATRRKSWLTSGLIALLTGPHHTSFSELASLTTLLSKGERPVFEPEYAVRAPVDVMAEPVS